MSNFRIIPDGNLINFDNVEKIEVKRGTVYICYVSGIVEDFKLDNEWREILKNLAEGGE